MASGTIKGISIRLGADASELTSALHKAESSIKQTQKQLREVNRALKFNPGNIDLLKQKEELLNRKIADTKELIDKMKAALKQMDAQGVEKTSDEYMALQREIIGAESKQKQFTKELKKVQAEASKFGQLGNALQGIGQKLDSISSQARAASITCAACATAIGGLAYKSAVGADDINTLSKVTGISTDKLQLYAQAADLVDVSVSALAKSQTRMKKSMLTAQSGTGAAAEAYNKLGVAVTKSDGSLREQDAVFQDVLTALGNMKNETERDALAMQIFGKSATELNPLIEDCGETYKNVAQAFADNNIEIVDQETLDNANRFNDAIDKIKATGSQAFFALGASLAETLAPVMESISEKLQSVAGIIANLNPKVVAIVGTITGIAAVILGMLAIAGKVIIFVGTVVKLLPTVIGLISAVNAALLANPIILIVAGIMAFVAAMVVAYKKSESFRNVINAIGAFLKGVFLKALNLVKSAIQRATAAINVIRNAFSALIGKIRSVASSIKSTLMNAFSKLGSIGHNIVSGIWNGISNGLGWIKGKIRGWVGNVKDFLKNLFGIHSPSRWARDVIGYNLVAGMANGIAENAGLINSAMNGLVPDMSFTGRASATMGNSMGSSLVDALSGVERTTIIEIDGRAFAQTTAPYMKQSIGQIDTLKNRRLGVL